MNIFLSILAIISIAFSSFMIREGVKTKDSSLCRIGSLILVSTVTLVLFHFLGCIIAMIIILGIYGSLCTFLGITGEDDKDFQDVGMIYCTIGTVLFFVCFYYWYQEGWYVSMTIALLVLACILFVHIIVGKGIPLMSSSMFMISLFAIVHIVRIHDVDIIKVFIIGGLGGLLLHIIGSEARRNLL